MLYGMTGGAGTSQATFDDINATGAVRVVGGWPGDRRMVVPSLRHNRGGLRLGHSGGGGDRVVEATMNDIYCINCSCMLYLRSRLCGYGTNPAVYRTLAWICAIDEDISSNAYKSHNEPVEQGGIS